MINNAILVGRLTKDVELRYTANGTAVGNFTLAVDRPFKSQNGERATDFINCQIWRKPAENLASFTRKGSLIGVQGNIQTRNFDNKEGQRVYITEVVVGNFALLESKNEFNKREQQSNAGNGNSQGGYQNQHQTGFDGNQGSYNHNSNFQHSGDPMDISDEDLPF